MRFTVNFLVLALALFFHLKSMGLYINMDQLICARQGTDDGKPYVEFVLKASPSNTSTTVIRTMNQSDIMSWEKFKKLNIREL